MPNLTGQHIIFILVLVQGEDAPERDIIEVALTKAKGMSPCGLEGHCESEEEAETIKNFIKDMLDEYADYGQPPSGDEIMKRLQKELNMDPVFANELVKVSLSNWILLSSFN